MYRSQRKRRQSNSSWQQRAELVAEFIGVVSTEYLHELIGYKPPRTYQRRNATPGADTC